MTKTPDEIEMQEGHPDAERRLREILKADGQIARMRAKVSEGDARRSASYALAKAERVTGSGAAQAQPR